MSKKIAIVTGASSGIGRVTAQLLADSSYYVFAAARRMHRLEEIRSDNIEPIQLDVTDAEGINNLVAHAEATRGRIDLLVNNAAFAQLGAVECVSMEAAHRQFEVNVFGYARFMQAVLPIMRRQGSGRIINVTSVVGKVSMAAFGWYAASKHALEALSDAARAEVMQFGIDVIVIEPGLIDTEFLKNQLDLLAATPHPPEYANVVESADHITGGKAADPAIVAEAILQAATASRPPVRHALPMDAKAATLAKRILGERVSSWVARRIGKL